MYVSFIKGAIVYVISDFVRAISIHSLVQYNTTIVVFDRSDCNDFIF